MTEDSISVQFGAQTGELESGVDRAMHKLGEVYGEVEHLEEMFKHLGKRMIEVFALREIAEFVEKMSEMGEQALRSAAMLGLTVEQMHELGYAAKLAGNDSDSFQQSMGSLRAEHCRCRKGQRQSSRSIPQPRYQPARTQKQLSRSDPR